MHGNFKGGTGFHSHKTKPSIDRLLEQGDWNTRLEEARAQRERVLAAKAAQAAADGGVLVLTEEVKADAPEETVERPSRPFPWRPLRAAALLAAGVSIGVFLANYSGRVTEIALAPAADANVNSGEVEAQLRALSPADGIGPAPAAPMSVRLATLAPVTPAPARAHAAITDARPVVRPEPRPGDPVLATAAPEEPRLPQPEVFETALELTSGEEGAAGASVPAAAQPLALQPAPARLAGVAHAPSVPDGPAPVEPVAAAPPEVAAPVTQPLTVAPEDIAPEDIAPVAVSFAPRPRPGEAAGDIAVFVMAPTGLSASAVQKAQAQVARSGLALQTPRRTAYSISRNNVRFYHASDRNAADELAGRMGAELRDFTDFRPQPDEGTIELWLAGRGNPKPAEPETRDGQFTELKWLRDAIARAAGRL
ncbi:MAG: hypothetical protein AAGF74_03925 [Pseudomonadota bacterium]